MYGWSKLNKNESGQAALEAAIILIAFVVVASVFAFAILSAGSASTEKGEQAIYSGLEGVQSSLEIKGAVTGTGDTNALTEVIFTVALVAGGEPVKLGTDGASAAAASDVVISYLDATHNFRALDFGVDYIVEKTADVLLEAGELAQITVDLATLQDGSTTTSLSLGPNTAFSLQVKPPTGGILQINRTTPAAIGAVVELR